MGGTPSYINLICFRKIRRVPTFAKTLFKYQVNSCFLPVNKQKKDLRLSQGGGQTEFNSYETKNLKQCLRDLLPGQVRYKNIQLLLFKIPSPNGRGRELCSINTRTMT